MNAVNCDLATTPGVGMYTGVAPLCLVLVGAIVTG